MCHISKWNPKPAASPERPSLPCTTATSSVICQPGSATSACSQHKPHVVFAERRVDSHELQTRAEGLYPCHTWTWQSSAWPLPQHSKKEPGAWISCCWDPVLELSRSTRFASDSALCGPAAHLSATQFGSSLSAQKPRKKLEQHKLLLWPWILSWLIVVNLQMKVKGLNK